MPNKKISRMSIGELRKKDTGWKIYEYNGFVQIKDMSNGGKRVRIRIDPPDKITRYRHIHIYDKNGNLLDIKGRIVSPEALKDIFPISEESKLQKKFNEIQEKIDNINYWDCKVLDISMSNFGNNISIMIENGYDIQKKWLIEFSDCKNVCYETDADFRIKEGMHNEILYGDWGYFAQNISIKKSKQYNEFIDVELQFSIFKMKLSCFDINIEEKIKG